MSKTVQVELPCRIEGEELELKGNLLAVKIEERKRLESERREMMRESKESIDAVKGEIDGLAHAVATRTEQRMVEVEEHLDPERRKIIRVRTDTGEAVSVRDASDADRTLFDGEERPPARVIEAAERFERQAAEEDPNEWDFERVQEFLLDRDADPDEVPGVTEFKAMGEEDQAKRLGRMRDVAAEILEADRLEIAGGDGGDEEDKPADG